MLDYIKFIRNIVPEYGSEIYINISSREKLVVYSMVFLEKNKIPLLFNYICISAFKLFPEKFRFGEFDEYPHIEMLNRTILHLRPVENNYAEGSVRQGYKITELGYYIASEVENQLKGKTVTKKVNKIIQIDAVKKNPMNDLKKIEQNKIYKLWLSDDVIDESSFWNFFKVTPYSRINYVKREIKDIKLSAKLLNNDKIFKFMEFLEKKINSLI
ncbi:MAG: hypothetical protein WC123_04310 [Bacilli bacterium]|nr:hypothetical protein [Bacilli bacterium]